VAVRGQPLAGMIIPIKERSASCAGTVAVVVRSPATISSPTVVWETSALVASTTSTRLSASGQRGEAAGSIGQPAHRSISSRVQSGHAARAFGTSRNRSSKSSANSILRPAGSVRA
jgi:hypothetical protein